MVEASYPTLAETGFSKSLFTEQELKQLAEKYGTPFFIIDEKTLRDKLNDLETAFSSFAGPVRVAYSLKANYLPAVIRVYIPEGILFDLTSCGELYFYLRCGGLPENVIYTSVTEEREEYSEVIGKGVTRIIVSSYNGLVNLINVVEKLETPVKVLIRINPEVGVKAEVRASLRNGKFGVPFNTGTYDSATVLLRKIKSCTKLLFEGFHFHLGSQILDPSCFINALDKLENFILKMRREFPDLEIQIIDIGGGTPVYYGIRVPTPAEIGRVVTAKLNSIATNISNRFTLIVESGRYLSAEAGMLVSKIANTKLYANQKFVFVDAGYHLLLDAALLRQEYPQEVIPKSNTTEDVKTNLVGRLCDTFDSFPISPVSKLAGSESGRLVLFHNVGAYSIVFNMPFHCQTRPPVLMKLLTGECVLIRKRESLEQLFEVEGGNPKAITC